MIEVVVYWEIRRAIIACMDAGISNPYSEREIVVYWYSFSNHRTVCIHYGFSLVGNNLNNTLRTP